MKWKSSTGCRLVLLESNYDENMLLHRQLPLYLKQRILSDNGHLPTMTAPGFQINYPSGTASTTFILGHPTGQQPPDYRRQHGSEIFSLSQCPWQKISARCCLLSNHREVLLSLININLIAVGKFKEDYPETPVRNTLNVSQDSALFFTWTDEARLPDNPSPKEISAGSGTKKPLSILKFSKGFLIPLCIEGKQISSPFSFHTAYFRRFCQRSSSVSLSSEACWSAEFVKIPANFRTLYVCYDFPSPARKSYAAWTNLSCFSRHRRGRQIS